MSLRWRKSGALICGAKCNYLPGDTYIDDRLHYQLSLILEVITPDGNEAENGLWHWIMDEEGLAEYERINIPWKIKLVDEATGEQADCKSAVLGSIPSIDSKPE